MSSKSYIYTRSGTFKLTAARWIIISMAESIAQFVKQRRKMLRLTQPDMAYKAGVGLRFVRELEQGKATLQLDKVNRVLGLFGHEVGPVAVVRSPWTDEV